MALNEKAEELQVQGSGNKQKLSHKQWKKLKRKQKRQALAKERVDSACPAEKGNGTDTEEEERLRQATEEENLRQHTQWERRDRLAHQQWAERQEQEERERQKREETERKIREEWEERERKDREEKEKKEKEEAERKEKQDSLLKQATQNEHKEWHNPLAPVNYNSNSNSEIIREVNKCPFFTKTGACRFGDRCSRFHLRPDSSTILLIAGMFESFELKKSSIDDYDTDMNLEYEESELYSSFREFYHDVVPEFKSVGRVVNVKVCCNHEPHLRGNVYVQYKRDRVFMCFASKRESEAHDAFIKFNARWYGGRQLTCEFVNIAKWKSAICGLFFRKKCPKGKTCNFLHVFRNPGNEFWEADRDFGTSSRYNRHDETPVWRPHSERRSHHGRRSRSRSRTRDSSRSYSSHHRSSRNRSRSPLSRSHSRRKSTERSPPETGRKRNISPRHSPHREQAHSRSKERARSRSKERARSRSKERARSRSKERARSRSKERARSGSKERAHSRSKERARSRSKERARYRSRETSYNGNTDSRRKNSRQSRSRSASRDRSWEGQCVPSRKRSRSRSCSTESRGPDKKHKKAKHKKSKKSSKKKKKHASSPSQGPVSFSRPGDSDEDMEVMRDSEVKEKHSKDSDDSEMEAKSERHEQNGV